MKGIVWRHPLLSLRTPEWVLGMYLFLLNFTWEMLQTPFFLDMPRMPHWPATLICAQATLGDVLIGVASFSVVSLAWRDRGWFLVPERAMLALYVAVGVLLTIGLEIHAVSWAGRWAYAPSMPVIPALGVGLVPILQWLVIPPVALFILRRHHLGVSGRIPV
jgi:hypothetical protein